MFRLDRVSVVILAVSVPLVGLDLARSSVSGGKSFEYASELTAIGPRLTGSSSYQRAAEWCADRFRAVGIARVELDPFTIERGWERVSAAARDLSPCRHATTENARTPARAPPAPPAVTRRTARRTTSAPAWPAAGG